MQNLVLFALTPPPRSIRPVVLNRPRYRQLVKGLLCVYACVFVVYYYPYDRDYDSLFKYSLASVE